MWFQRKHYLIFFFNPIWLPNHVTYQLFLNELNERPCLFEISCSQINRQKDRGENITVCPPLGDGGNQDYNFNLQRSAICLWESNGNKGISNPYHDVCLSKTIILSKETWFQEFVMQKSNEVVPNIDDQNHQTSEKISCAFGTEENKPSSQSLTPLTQ